ncbi:uncharacterized protein LOC110038253 isoform X3 [Phalaenopsis equestris]|uniref:uncharacterized protein LOC110038253 isoform X3 n=1 Tax=Phalaenopsis equestris TaxID=78828 RepID=UPI0009E30D64|nr:uncharacterized protein LOC110038253 isoform X3 [Phalaenopsis equestris]XP_020598691.1 uncharacterized protein LOC110038253 isoform X3 [Phalaenopsis equestris]
MQSHKKISKSSVNLVIEIVPDEVIQDAVVAPPPYGTKAVINKCATDKSYMGNCHTHAVIGNLISRLPFFCFLLSFCIHTQLHHKLHESSLLCTSEWFSVLVVSIIFQTHKKTSESSANLVLEIVPGEVIQDVVVDPLHYGTMEAKLFLVK